MTPEQVKQIVETIKTLNLNIDSTTASAIVSQLKPIFYFILIKSFILSILGLIAFVLAIYFISKAVRSFYNKKEND